MSAYNLSAPGILFIFRLFQTKGQMVIWYIIYLLFAVLLIVDSFYLVQFNYPAMILWGLFVLIGLWVIKHAIRNKKTSLLSVYIICSSLWWTGAILFSGGLDSPIFYFAEILMILYALTASYVMNAIGGILYIATVGISSLFIPVSSDDLPMLISIIAVNLLTNSAGFLASYAITHYNKSFDQWQKRALSDYLTGLYNREGFIEFFSPIEQKNGLFGLFDLNGFKKINDTYGHAFGDNVLSEVARTLEKSLENIAMLGRIGGDEFVFYIPCSDPDDEMLAFSKQLIEQSIKQAGSKLNINLTASVGLLPITKEQNQFRDLYRLSDELMYQNKRLMKNTGEL